MGTYGVNVRETPFVNEAVEAYLNIPIKAIPLIDRMFLVSYQVPRPEVSVVLLVVGINCVEGTNIGIVDDVKTNIKNRGTPS